MSTGAERRLCYMQIASDFWILVHSQDDCSTVRGTHAWDEFKQGDMRACVCYPEPKGIVALVV